MCKKKHVLIIYVCMCEVMCVLLLFSCACEVSRRDESQKAYTLNHCSLEITLSPPCLLYDLVYTMQNYSENVLNTSCN